MTEIDYKHEVPRKGDRKGWRVLEEAIKGHWLKASALISKRHQNRR